MLVPMQSPEFELEVTPSGGTYSGIGVTGNMFDPNLPEGTYTITYEYTDSNSCFNLCTFDIAIFEGAMAPEADLRLMKLKFAKMKQYHLLIYQQMSQLNGRGYLKEVHLSIQLSKTL